jgi:RNA polymerase sigma factor (sigma-70 family)
MDVNAAPRASDCPCRELADDPGAAAAGFDDWVTRLVHAHRGFLAGVARREGLAPEDAFDAVQEAFGAFLVLPRARALCEAPEEARNMLVALTRNIARNARRLHVRARPHDSRPAVVEAIASADAPADRRLAEAEDRGRLARCVARLAQVQRAVLTLRMLDELPGEDVARLLGLEPGHVAVLLHRAKASLRECMGEETRP